jgi:hypothetical protein
MKYIKLFEYFPPDTKFEVVEKYPMNIEKFFIDAPFEDFISFISKNYPKSSFLHTFFNSTWDSYNKGKIFILLSQSTLWSKNGVIESEPVERLLGITMSYDGNIKASGWDNNKLVTAEELNQASSVIFNSGLMDEKLKEYLEEARSKDAVLFSRTINKLDTNGIFQNIAKYFKEKYPAFFKAGSILSRFSN